MVDQEPELGLELLPNGRPNSRRGGRWVAVVAVALLAWLVQADGGSARRALRSDSGDGGPGLEAWASLFADGSPRWWIFEHCLSAAGFDFNDR